MLVKLLLVSVPTVAEMIFVGFITNWAIGPGWTSKVFAVPVGDPPVKVAVKVKPLPAAVGVTLTPLNTPDEKVTDVPVMPAVPP
jgi:hypothetical protein